MTAVWMKASAWQRAAARNDQRRLLKLIQETDATMVDIVSDTAKKSERLIARSVGGKGIGAQVRLAQYRQVRSSMFQLATDMWGDQVPAAVLNGIDTSSQMAVNAQKEMLAFLSKIAPDAASMLVESMRHSAAQTFESLRSRLLNGVNLSPNVYRNRAYMMGKIDSIVNEGILLQQSAKEIADNVYQHINPKVVGGQKYAAMRLGRTELNNAYHSTSIRSYQQSPYVEGVQWSLSGSHAKPDDCDAYAGDDSYNMGTGVFPTNNVPDKPHPQCFCFITAITPDPDEFLRRLQRGEYNCG